MKCATGQYGPASAPAAKRYVSFKMNSMKSIVLVAALMLVSIQLSFAGEFPKPSKASDIAGTWEATSLDRYLRLIIRENGTGMLISSGAGNTLDVYSIETIVFGNKPFDFSVSLRHSEDPKGLLQFNGAMWFSSTCLLLFHPHTGEPMSDPPVASFLREGTFNALREAAQKSERSK